MIHFQAKSQPKPEVFIDTVWMRQTWDITSMSFHPSSQFFAVGNEGKYVGIWDVQTGTETKKYNGFESRNVFFSKSGKYLIQGNNRGFIIWDFTSDTSIFSWFGSDDYSSFSLSMSTDERLIATGGRNYIKIWDIQTKKLLKTIDTTILKPNPPNTNFIDVLKLDFSPDGKLLAFPYSTSDKEQTQDIIIYNLQDNKIEYRKNLGNYGRIKFSNDGTKISYTSTDAGEAIKIMDVNTKHILATIPGFPQGVTKIVFSSDDKFLVFTYSTKILIWNLVEGKLKDTFTTEPPGYFIENCDISNDQKYLAGNSGSVLILWNFHKDVGVPIVNTLKGTMIFPNPAEKNTLNLTFDLIKSEMTTIKIFNIKGQLVKEIDNSYLFQGNHQYTINLSDLVNGSYQLRINSGSYSFSQSFIINR